MGFYDAKGYWRSDGDGFYDSKGYFRSPGDGFYDAKGYFRSPGDGFYDAKGYFRSPGDGFYDSRGNWVSGVVIGFSEDSRETIVATIGFLLFLPVAMLWFATIALIEWITAHLYIVFAVYTVIATIISVFISNNRKHKGIKFFLSFLGNFSCTLSFLYVTLLYAVPYVVINGDGFGSFFEFTLVLAFMFGLIAVLQSFNNYHRKAVVELILGVLFFLGVILFVKSGNEIQSVESLAQIYDVNASTLFRILFGFAV